MEVSGVGNWTCRHFSLANPTGPGQDDVPKLLRRVAEVLEELDPERVLDVVFHKELTDDGWSPSFTVYFVARQQAD
jgi:hypothetical protein